MVKKHFLDFDFKQDDQSFREFLEVKYILYCNYLILHTLILSNSIKNWKGNHHKTKCKTLSKMCNFELNGMELLSILNCTFILIIISKVEYILHGIIVKQREIAWNYCQCWIAWNECQRWIAWCSMELLYKLNCLEWMSKLNIVWSINVTVELHGIDVNRILRKRDSENLLIIPRQMKMRKYTPDMWKNSLGNFSICCAYLYEMICFCALQKCTYICIDVHHM